MRREIDCEREDGTILSYGRISTYVTIEPFSRRMLSAAHVLAMDAKNLLDVVDTIRIRYPHVNSHIVRGNSSSSGSHSASSSASSSLEKQKQQQQQQSPTAQSAANFGSVISGGSSSSSGGSGGSNFVSPASMQRSH